MSETNAPSAGLAGLLLCDDFIWISRISGTASALGLPFKVARTPEQLEGLAREFQPKCVVLDLSAVKVPVDEVVARVKSVCSVAPRFTAFGSHIDTQLLRAARDAGCDPVLARSQFAESLPGLLKSWLSGES